jgi:hypothetical protein
MNPIEEFIYGFEKIIGVVSIDVNLIEKEK